MNTNYREAISLRKLYFVRTAFSCFGPVAYLPRR